MTMQNQTLKWTVDLKRLLSGNMCESRYVCISSPHSAESQEAIEQCVQQVICHIWTEHFNLSFCGSFLLLRWASFRPAEEQRQKKYVRQETTVQPNVWQETDGLVGGIDIIQILVAVIQISLAFGSQADTQWCTPTSFFFACMQTNRERPKGKDVTPTVWPPALKQTDTSIWIYIQSGSSFYVSCG